MDNGSQTEEVQESGVVEEISGAKSFQGALPDTDPLRRQGVPRPDHVPEKFWDAETGAVRYDDLLKSYGELEKLVGKPKDAREEVSEETTEETEEKSEETSEETQEETSEETEEDKEEAEATPALKDAVAVAQAAYAETGELTAEARQPLLDQGITNEQIDFYIQGVKAQEKALQLAAVQAAGVDDFSQVEEAIAWAAEHWSEKKILAFNQASGDVDTVGLAVAGLFTEFRADNPGEGQLTNINSGANRGDVYTDREEFQRDLNAADKAGDRLARKAAVAKMQRSQRLKTLKR